VAIDRGLRPVQSAVVGGDGVRIAPVGLDFFQPVQQRRIAVGAPAYDQGMASAAQFQGFGQEHFLFVARWPTGAYDGMALYAFECCGRRGEAQVKVSRACGEVAQCTHGYV